MTPRPDPAPSRLPDFIDARSSLALLGVRQQTLYAYVSRGAIRSIPQPGTKAHLYSRADIERVVARAAARAGHGAAAAGAMDHGPPIVSSGITEITQAGPCYRGHLASDLAQRNVPFEKVCELLWGGRLHLSGSVAWRIPPRDQARIADACGGILQGGNPHFVYEALAMLALQLERVSGRAAVRDPSRAVAQDARLLIGAVAAAIGCLGATRAPALPSPSEPIASSLLRSFGCESAPERVRALNAALVLLADHELPPGTLAVRAAASGGASLFDCIAVGICASAGTEIAGHYDVVDRFIAGKPTVTALRDKALRFHGRGQRVPGFTHPLYPHGDPRARYLLGLADELSDKAFNVGHVGAFVRWAEEEFGDHPRHEFGVVCLVRALGMPAWSAGVLFLVARMAGWAAHVQEQRGATGLWRPRARYVPVPELEA